MSIHSLQGLIFKINIVQEHTIAQRATKAHIIHALMVKTSQSTEQAMLAFLFAKQCTHNTAQEWAVRGQSRSLIFKVSIVWTVSLRLTIKLGSHIMMTIIVVTRLLVNSWKIGPQVFRTYMQRTVGTTVQFCDDWFAFVMQSRHWLAGDGFVAMATGNVWVMYHFIYEKHSAACSCLLSSSIVPMSSTAVPFIPKDNDASHS